VQLELGDRLVFCSDGIIEAENPDGDFFGFDRTAEIIARGCADGLTADSLLELIVEQVEVFSGNAPQGDDRTVVVMGMEK
jgi:serine phosphatase RsbU (regulator of sigma subunit)